MKFHGKVHENFHGKFHEILWDFMEFHEIFHECHGKNVMEKIRQMFMKNFMKFHVSIQLHGIFHEISWIP
jgi:tRNA C32,U32 (ribose-2'-O)-methylase TrmJ